MSAMIEINPKTPRTLQIDKVQNDSAVYVELHLSELTKDERVLIAAWALQDIIIK
jgi:hypothetical protein